MIVFAILLGRAKCWSTVHQTRLLCARLVLYAGLLDRHDLSDAWPGSRPCSFSHHVPTKAADHPRSAFIEICSQPHPRSPPLRHLPSSFSSEAEAPRRPQRRCHGLNPEASSRHLAHQQALSHIHTEPGGLSIARLGPFTLHRAGTTTRSFRCRDPPTSSRSRRSSTGSVSARIGP